MAIQNDPRFRSTFQPLSGESELGSTRSTGSVKRAGHGDDSHYLGVRSGGSSSVSRGFSRLTGSGGSSASAMGFDLLRSFERLTHKTKKIVVGSLIGFTLLMPPITGQLMHPGAPKATNSPVAMMVEQTRELPSGAQIRGQVDRARSQIPGGVGEARENALRGLISVHDQAREVMRESNRLSSSAQRVMDQLREEVGADARMGYAVDWYWFGVPENHANYHGGKVDSKGIEDRAESVRDATEHARTVARDEVSNLLKLESPAYADLHARYTHEHNRLTAAQDIRQLADHTADALSDAKHAIYMRNLTPRTIEEPVYETRTKTETNADGTTSTTSEYVQTGTRTVDNPEWHLWNTAAIVAKSRAEQNIRDLNREVQENRQLLGIEGRIDGNLINAWDFFGQPSFLLWSFDSQDVSRAQREAEQLRGTMDGMIGQIRVVHDRLERDVNAKIDARWNELAAGGSGGGQQQQDGERDPAVLRTRTQRNRRNDDDDGGDWNAGI